MAPEALARRLTAGLLACCCFAAFCCFALGCSRPRADDAKIAWTIDPTPPVAGSTTIVRFTLLDNDGRPAAHAKLRLEAHMAHPGMAPVTVDAIERGNGAYDAALQLPMAGDWVLVVSGALADGARITKEIRVPGVRPAQSR